MAAVTAETALVGPSLQGTTHATGNGDVVSERKLGFLDKGLPGVSSTFLKRNQKSTHDSVRTPGREEYIIILFGLKLLKGSGFVLLVRSSQCPDATG